MRLYFFREMPTLAVLTQIEMAKRDGYIEDRSPSWTDSPRRFPEQRDRMLKAVRSGADEVWIAALPILADGRADMRHVVAELERLAAAVVEGSTGWTLRPPYEQGLAFAHAWDVYSQQIVTDNPPCCEGCGSIEDIDDLRAKGFRSCCPERKMLTARQWYERNERLRTALIEIAQWDNGLKGDFSKSAKFAEIARAALSTPN